MKLLLDTVRDPQQRKIVEMWLWCDRLRWFVIGVIALMVAQTVVMVAYG